MVLSNLIKSHLAHSLSYFRLEGSYLTSSSITIQLKDDSRCSSTDDHGRKQIILGTKFYPTIRKVDPLKELSPCDVPFVHNELALVYEGVYFHELGHLLYTPISLVTNMYNTFRHQHATSFFQMFAFISNLVEDVAIEGEIQLLRPHVSPSIELLRRVCFNIPPKEITMDFDGAISLLLHNYRTVSSTKVVYPDEKMHKALMSWMYVCVNTSEPDLRAFRCLAFARMLWDVYNLEKAPHLSDYEGGLDSTFYTNIPEEYKDEKNKQAIPKYSNELENVEEKRASGGQEEVQSLEGQALTDTEGVDAKVVKAIPSTSTAEPIQELPAKPLAKHIYQEAFDAQTFTESRGHEIIDMTKYDHSTHRSLYNDVVHQYGSLINRVASIIKKQRSWNTSRWEPAKTSGVLNDKAFMKRTHKIYKQRTGKKHEADLLISILLDNSGSMSGQRTHICGKAVIVLAEVCHKLRIPFEIKAFTEYRYPTTLIFKNFNQLYERVKESLMWIVESTSHPEVTEMFHGNVDEVNLEALWRNMRTRKEKDKLIIVVSDGQTCGSSTNLRNVISKIEKDNISVLGLGIQSKYVADIYPSYKLFDSAEDLEELPGFLISYLKGKVFK